MDENSPKSPLPNTTGSESQEAPPREILIADEDAGERSFARRVLGARGYFFREVSTVDTLIPELERARPNLLLLDIALGGARGLELVTTIRRHGQLYNLPIIVVSALRNEETIRMALSVGADDYLVKPVTPGELAAKVHMVLKKRSLNRMTSMGFTYGAHFAGRYEIVSTVESGGYGTVYAANDLLHPDQPSVALKVVHSEKSMRPDFLSKFLREAYTHSRLVHPNIVRLIDFGQYDGVYFQVLEFLEGLNLEEVLSTSGLLSEETAVFTAYEVAKVLDYLRVRGVVHRDLKPRNIMITDEGEVKVLDFGMARHRRDETLSSSEWVGGTPQFVSPEYIRSSHEVDCQSDIYSFGMTLYYAVSGRFPFPEDGKVDFITHHLQTPPVPLRQYRPDLSEAFAGLVDRMLAKAKGARPDSVTMLRELVELMVPEGEDPGPGEP